MREELRERVRTYRYRLRRFERREIKQFRRWIENTSNLTHVSVLLFVPLLIALVTVLSNAVKEVSFLLFPPLASGTYTLFSEPEGKYSSPTRFVGGMTLGAFCGWAALEVSASVIYQLPPSTMGAHAGSAALGIFLTGVLTWMFDLELPTAFSTALLVLITGSTDMMSLFGVPVSAALVYVVGVFISTSLVASVFVVWRGEFYEERARYLYQTTQADDHVLVPMRGKTAAETAMFGARLAAAHDAAKVVLLDVVSDEDVAKAERARIEGRSDESPSYIEAESEGEVKVADEAARTLEQHATRIQTRVGVPCEVVVAVAEGALASTVVDTAAETNCDLIVAPYEENQGGLSSFLRGLLRSDYDTVVFRSVTGRENWKRIMVPVRRASDVAHAMLDYAERLAGKTGTVSVCSCISDERERRRVESMLADLAETLDVRCETRVSRTAIESFLQRNDDHYDLVFIGASTNRSTASRFVSPPTFENIRDVETDVAIVHRG